VLYLSLSPAVAISGQSAASRPSALTTLSRISGGSASRLKGLEIHSIRIRTTCRFEFDLSLFCSIGVGPRYLLISSVSNRSNPFSGRGPDDVEIDIVVPVSHDVR
jgi:hypothetical protein